MEKPEGHEQGVGRKQKGPWFGHFPCRANALCVYVVTNDH